VIRPDLEKGLIVFNPFKEGWSKRKRGRSEGVVNSRGGKRVLNEEATESSGGGGMQGRERNLKGDWGSRETSGRRDGYLRKKETSYAN